MTETYWDVLAHQLREVLAQMPGFDRDLYGEAAAKAFKDYAENTSWSQGTRAQFERFKAMDDLTFASVHATMENQDAQRAAR